jgi:hypothetical protein
VMFIQMIILITEVGFYEDIQTEKGKH